MNVLDPIYRHLGRRLVVLAGVTIALLLPAGSATAGGPTSVLLASPVTQDTASFYATDREYGQLVQALGESPRAAKDAPYWSSGPGMVQVNITWLIHDVSVWRIDHVVKTADGLWIETRGALNGDPIDLGQRGVWHRPADPDLLLDLLNGLDLLQSAEKPDSLALDRETAPLLDAGEHDGSGGSGRLWWALPSLIVGALIGVAGRPSVSRLVDLWRRQRRLGPRQQLIDG